MGNDFPPGAFCNSIAGFGRSIERPDRDASPEKCRAAQADRCDGAAPQASRARLRRAAAGRRWCRHQRRCLRRADRFGAPGRQHHAAQHQRRRRQRKPARPHAAPNAGDGRGDRPADAQGSRAADHRGGGAGRGRRDGRRGAGRAIDLFHARLRRRPDQHALQRHQGRPVDHDRPPDGRGQSRADRDPERPGLAAVGRRRDRRRDQLRDQEAAHRKDRERGVHVVRFHQRIPQRLRLRRQYGGQGAGLPLRCHRRARQQLHRRHLQQAPEYFRPARLPHHQQFQGVGRGRTQGGQGPVLLGHAAGAGQFPRASSRPTGSSQGCGLNTTLVRPTSSATSVP